jgi:hypothetical protein
MMLLAPLLLLAAAQTEQSDPLAPAREGRIRCIGPDRQARTCATMVRYTLHEAGGFDAEVSGVVSLQPLVVIDYRTSGGVEDGAVCSIVRPVDFTAGKLSKSGAPMTAALESQVRSNVMLALQPLAGKRRCYRDRQSGEELASDVTIDGALRPDLAQRAIWVKAEDGYTTGM